MSALPWATVLELVGSRTGLMSNQHQLSLKLLRLPYLLRLSRLFAKARAGRGGRRDE